MNCCRLIRTAATSWLPPLALLMALQVCWSPPAIADPLEVDWITQYYNELLNTAHLADPPKMLRNIQNSLMTSAPSVLEGAIYLERRTYAWSGLEGIAELSEDWLRADRVSLSKSAVAVVAVREPFYPGAGSLLSSLGWTPLDESITLAYYEDPAQLVLYAGLVNAGPVDISGAGVVDLLDENVANSSPHFYFFFQDAAAFSPETLAQLQSVSVPEPGTFVLCGVGAIVLAGVSRRSARSPPRATPCQPSINPPSGNRICKQCFNRDTGTIQWMTTR